MMRGCHKALASTTLESVSKWIGYIHAMFTNNWFSVLYNGGVHGYFHSTRGLRQGDLLAPSLFILAEEVLSRGLSHLLEQGRSKPYHVPRREAVHQFRISCSQLYLKMDRNPH